MAIQPFTPGGSRHVDHLLVDLPPRWQHMAKPGMVGDHRPDRLGLSPVGVGLACGSRPAGGGHGWPGSVDCVPPWQ